MTNTISKKSLLNIVVLTIIYIGINCPNSVFGKANRQIPKITISESNIPLKKVFGQIKKQADITIYNNVSETELNEQKRVTVNFIQAEIGEVMRFLLYDKANLYFIQRNKDVYIYKKNIYISSIDTISRQIDITGKIVDKDNNPIPGASIKVKSTQFGTISNTDGSFRISEVNRGGTLIITSIGYESREVIITEFNTLIQLKSHTNILDEKVVIAYGSTTKRLNTGNIGSLKAKDIENQLVSNPLMAIQGRIPGIYIEQSTGLPGSGVTVRIQGTNSINGGREPYYVIDGVPYISQLLPTNNLTLGYSGQAAGNPLNYINNADIESIEVLKDADATAIYGSRAANGAILITTKKGKTGPVRVNLMVQNGWGKVGNKIKLLNTKEYLEMRHEGLYNDGTDISSSGWDWDLNGSWDTTRNVDWQKRLLGNTAQYKDAQLNVSGGTATAQYLIGAGFHKETTVLPGSFSDTKASVHFNLNSSSPDQKFKTQFVGSYLYDDNQLPLLDITLMGITLAPVVPEPYREDGSLNWQPDANGSSTNFINPIAPLTEKSNNKTTNLTSNAILGYEVIPGLIFKSSFGYNNLLTNEIGKSPKSKWPPEFQPLIPNSTTFITNRISSWIIEPQIEYRHKIYNGNLNALLGSTITQQNNDQQNVTGIGFNNDLVMEDLTSATSMFASTLNSVYKYNALYGRLTYNWADKYILNLSARRDGSSRFGSKNQFHNFAAVGGAWVFSQEPFIQSRIPILSFGKIRASYGTTGSDQIGDYQFMNIYTPYRVSGTPYQGTVGLLPNGLINPYLQWEETKKFQLGLELGLLKDKILFSINYNNNRSSNQLGGIQLTSITGASVLSKNIPAVIQNAGWEITLSTTNIKTKHFIWSTNFNITIPKNILLSYYGKDKNNSYALGKPLSSRLYYKYVGINDTTGKYQFQDAKGNITVTPSDPADRIVVANTDPKYYGGLQNSLSYKGISLDFFFMFARRSIIDMVTYGIANINYPGQFQGGGGNQSTKVLDRWQKPGDKTTIQPYSAGNNVNLNYIKNSDAILVDGSYIRLKNIALSWLLPDNWKKILHLQSGRVFVNAQNIFTLKNYIGLDPETNLSMPPLRTITLGVQITL